MDTLKSSTTVAPVPEAPAVAASPSETKEVSGNNKQIRFKNRAENQASKILASLEDMKKLSNRKYYDFTDAQVTELFAALQSALDDAKNSFTADKPEKEKLLHSLYSSQ